MVQDKYEAAANESDKDVGRPVLGDFIRMQRQMANMSLRQLSALTEISNPYLSQVERGLHEPSIRVLKSIANALNVSSEILFEQAGLIKIADRPDDDATETAIRLDWRLTEAQRHALLGVYRSFVDANGDQSRTKSEGMTS
jgi:transcriptional regulator with XRE-family HTH domain